MLISEITSYVEEKVFGTLKVKAIILNQKSTCIFSKIEMNYGLKHCQKFNTFVL